MKVIDVRSPQEYNEGHAKGAINIPLQEIADRVEEIESFSKPLILCCASGNRSGQAVAILKAKGIDCQNGGSWVDVQYKIDNKEIKI